MKKVAAHELVEALFDVVIDEARRNEAFARRLLNVFPEAIVARVERPKRRRNSFDASEYHAVKILRNHGEAMLRGRLGTLRKKTNLREVATRSGLRLTGRAARANASMSEIIDGIVEAAQHYEAQRGATKR